MAFNQEAYDRALLKLRDQYADLKDAGESVEAAFGNQLLVNMVGYAALPGGEDHTHIYLYMCIYIYIYTYIMITILF